MKNGTISGSPQHSRYAGLKSNILLALGIGLTILLILQVKLALRHAAPPGAAIRVEAKPSRSEFLISEVRPNSAEEPFRTQEFSLVNVSGKSLRLRVESASCACLGFSVDGQRIDRATTWPMQIGEAVSLGLIIPLRTSIGSYSMQFGIVAQGEKLEDVVFRRQLNVRTLISPDVVCVPPVLRFHPVETPNSDPSATIRVDHLTLADDCSLSPEVSIEGEAATTEMPFVLDSIEGPRAPQRLDGGLVKTTTLITVRYRAIPRTPGASDAAAVRALLRLRFAANAKLPVVEETVPLLISAWDPPK